MEDDDEIQVVEVTVRVYRPSLAVVSSYIRLELWWHLKQPLQGEVNHLWAKYRKIICKLNYFFFQSASICHAGRIYVTCSNICSYVLFQENN